MTEVCKTRIEAAQGVDRDQFASTARHMLSSVAALGCVMIAAALYTFVRPFSPEVLRWVASAVFVGATAQAVLLAGAVVHYESSRLREESIPAVLGALQLVMAVVWFAALAGAVGAFEMHNYTTMLKGGPLSHDGVVRASAGIMGAMSLIVIGMVGHLLHTQVIKADACTPKLPLSPSDASP